VAVRDPFPEPSTGRRKPAGRGIERRAVEGARAGLDCGSAQNGGKLEFPASRKPPEECPVTGVAALAKSFKFRQDRPLRHLLAFGISAHRVRLRLNMLRADFLEIIGDLACAKELAARIWPEAEAMGFADIAERARELLDDRTILMEFERDWNRFKHTDEDISFGNLSDQELRVFARDGLESLGLPPDRLEVLEQYCKSLREVARERSSWCRHLEMLEDMRQTRNPATAFSVLPSRKCVCVKLGYETENVSSDAQALISDLKRLYCGNCKDRNPKQQ